MMILILASALFATGSACAQNLVTNGDFEFGPYLTPGTVAGWTVSGTGHIAELAEGATSGTHAAALGEGGDFQGDVLSQTITTVPGQAYIFEFDGGVFGIPTNTLQLNFQVFGNAFQINETLAPPAYPTATPSQVEFHHYFRPFVADSTSTTIRFTDVGFGGQNADVLVDAVSVIVAPSPTPSPTPTTLPLVNGDFETWPFNDPGTVSGWFVGGNKHIETITQGATSPVHSAGFSVGGDSTGNTLTQTFVTATGQTYTLDFDAGVYGTRGGSPLQLQVFIFSGASQQVLSSVVQPPEIGTIHPSLVTFSHYHYTFTAPGTLGTVQFVDLVGNNGGADVMLDSVSILPQVPTFLDWQSIYFTAAQRGNPNISGWTADPDGDGVGNGLEYYFHMNPMNGVPAADQPSLPRVGLSSDGTNTYVTFTYHRLLGWTGKTPVVAISSDLVNWDTTQTQIEPVGSAARADGFTDAVTVRLKTPINVGPVPKKYFRLMLPQ